ncbi:UNVERIFIED_CONTAM: hypothetical protein K2H54_044961 [Gekko kuhli]
MTLLVIRVVALLLATSTGVSGQKEPVTQGTLASAKEGDPIQLHCSYTGNEYSLQWYKQHPSGWLEFMALLSTSGSKLGDSFVMSLDTKKKTTSLYLNGTRLQDSALYFCAMSHGGTEMHPVYDKKGSRTGVSGQKDSVSQDSSAWAKEGEPVQLNCSYGGTPKSLQWYKQSPGGADPVHGRPLRNDL